MLLLLLTLHVILLLLVLIYVPGGRVDMLRQKQLIVDGQVLWPTIVYDPIAKEVVGLVYSTQQSLDQSIAERRCVFYSRSRRCIWVKSGTTGQNAPHLLEIQWDCDRDALLFLVHMKPSQRFCHVPHQKSCFHQTVFTAQRPVSLRIGVVKGHTKSHAMNLLSSVGIHVYESSQPRNDHTLVKTHYLTTIPPSVVWYKKADAYAALVRKEVDFIVGFDDILKLSKVSAAATHTAAPSASLTTPPLPPHVDIISWYPSSLHESVNVRVVAVTRLEYQPHPRDTTDTKSATIRVRSEYHSDPEGITKMLHSVFPGHNLDIVYVHGGSELFVAQQLADVAIVVTSTGASLRAHGLVERFTIATHKLGIHLLMDTYVDKRHRRFFRQLKSTLDSRTLYFYTTDGPYGFMSNFALYPFQCREHGLVWASSEHYYQAHKFKPLSKEFEMVRQAPSPKACYKLAWTFASQFVVPDTTKTPTV